MESYFAKERLLGENSLDSLDEEDKPSPWRLSSNRFIALVLSLCLLLSLAANLVLLQHSQLQRKLSGSNCPSQYSGLGFDKGVAYHSQSEYWGDNITLADELWESLDTSPMVVALPYTEASHSGLAWSVPWFWDDDKGVYLIKAFHSLHCLKLVRKAVKDYALGRPDPVHMFHVDHCLDSLRQDIMCKADDTPMPSINQAHKTGDGQIMQCRDWDALVAWARHPDRHSCFEHIDEYRDPLHKLEQFAFCPEGHPSRGVMTAYFEKFGHKEAFAL